ncbi:MAG: hypothetical protein HY070_12170 [Chloroflexi bacterium]|nr:hypothetical protein [Chloroflexota bacterium]MBI3741993.1 hypothetical protein [Chloroflexota bacterium]
MLTKVISCAVETDDGALVDVEGDISTGQTGLTIVGLPDAAVQESRERVCAEIRNPIARGVFARDNVENSRVTNKRKPFQK